MFWTVYVVVGLAALLAGLFWLGFNFIVTGFGPAWCAGFCAGGIFMLIVMYLGAIWAKGSRKRDEARGLPRPRPF